MSGCIRDWYRLWVGTNRRLWLLLVIKRIRGGYTCRRFWLEHIKHIPKTARFRVCAFDFG